MQFLESQIKVTIVNHMYDIVYLRILFAVCSKFQDTTCYNIIVNSRILI